jgi:hypothetical protein
MAPVPAPQIVHSELGCCGVPSIFLDAADCPIHRAPRNRVLLSQVTLLCASRPTRPEVSRLMTAALRVIVAFVLLAGGTHAAHAQMQWSRSTAIGYGLAGAALGVIPALDMDFDEVFWAPPLAGMIAGAVVGHLVGERAERKLARGHELTPTHRTSIRLGTVMLGITTGAAIASLAINPEGPSRLGSDEAILTAGALGGAALGAVVQWRLEPQLRPERVQTGVHVMPGRGAIVVLRYVP